MDFQGREFCRKLVFEHRSRLGTRSQSPFWDVKGKRCEISGRLFFYSDQVIESPGNRNLDTLLLADHVPAQIRIGYIPSTADPDRQFFRNKAAYYGEYGVRHLLFFDLYGKFDRGKVSDLLACDIIHLSAGNPLQFRQSLMARGISTILRDYYHAGGTLVGVSGGAVQLGQSARLFQLLTGSLDDSVDSGSDLRTLQLVDFDFLPHFNRWTEPVTRVGEILQISG